MILDYFVHSRELSGFIDEDTLNFKFNNFIYFGNIMIKYITVLIFVFFCSAHSQTNDEQFNTFINSFKEKIQKNIISETADYLNFPFVSSWGTGEDNITRDSFQENKKYHSVIPGYSILSNAEFDKEKTKNGLLIKFYTSGDDYVISYLDISEEEGSDGEFHFKKIDGEYKYYKLVSSALNGPPYDPSK